MNQFTIDLRDALVTLGSARPEPVAEEPAYVELAGKRLLQGKYGRDRGYAKAFIIVAPDGLAFYQNKSGITGKRLTDKAFLTHWDAGMSTYLGEI